MATTVTALVSEEEYRRLALDDESGKLELFRGQLREKPWMSARHGRSTIDLVAQLLAQLDRRRYRVSLGQARLRVWADTYYIPDVVVLTAEMERKVDEDSPTLDAHVDPAPLVVEIWSPSTGTSDIDRKIPGYRQRGDLEIWRIHPIERTLTIWQRQPDGSYTVEMIRGGIVEPASLPGVTIDFDALFVS